MVDIAAAAPTASDRKRPGRRRFVIPPRSEYLQDENGARREYFMQLERSRKAAPQQRKKRKEAAAEILGMERSPEHKAMFTFIQKQKRQYPNKRLKEELMSYREKKSGLSNIQRDVLIHWVVEERIQRKINMMGEITKENTEGERAVTMGSHVGCEEEKTTKETLDESSAADDDYDEEYTGIEGDEAMLPVESDEEMESEESSEEEQGNGPDDASDESSASVSSVSESDSSEDSDEDDSESNSGIRWENDGWNSDDDSSICTDDNGDGSLVTQLY